MKLAIGLFHFSPQQLLQSSTRLVEYCDRVVLPFLDWLEEDRHVRLSLSTPGNVLEAIHEASRATINRLRAFVSSGRVELISPLYAPSLWVAYPYRDLERSIQVNRQCLQNIGLEPSRTFFADNGFFGPGVTRLQHDFDAAVCSDEYASYVLGSGEIQPAYRVRGMLVVVGGGHLAPAPPGLRAAVRNVHTPQASQSSFSTTIRSMPSCGLDPAKSRTGTGAHELHWYHLGSAHHFACCNQEYRPEWLNDAAWLKRNRELMSSLAQAGCEFVTVRELVGMLRDLPWASLPALVEGGWSPVQTRGIYRWMGGQHSVNEAHDRALAIAWRTRAELACCASPIDCAPLIDETAGRDSARWKAQLIAESAHVIVRSDGTGFAGHECRTHGKPESIDSSIPDAGLSLESGAETAAPVPIQIMGGKGVICCRRATADAIIVQATFTSIGPDCGLRFVRNTLAIRYCPTGFENEGVVLGFDKVGPGKIFLPLTNGLISLADDIHLIRDNRAGVIAACVSRSDNHIFFINQNVPVNRAFEWRFVIILSTFEHAVPVANAINCV